MNATAKLALFSAAAGLALALGAPARADAPPSPWIGEGSGSTQVDANGLWTVQGNGLNDPNPITGAYIVYQHLQGDGSITAHVLTARPQPDAAAGLFVEEDNSVGATGVNYLITAAGTAPTVRSARGGPEITLVNSGPYNTPHALYLRLQRLGNAVTGFYSTDGTLWSPDFDPVALPSLKNDAFFGVTVENENGASASKLYTGTFDQVQVQAGATLVASMRALAGDQQVALQWEPLPNALGYDLYRGPAGAHADQLVKLNSARVTGAMYTDRSAGLVDGTQVTYGVAAVFAGAGGNPVEGPVEVLPATPGTAPSGYLGSSLLEGPVSGFSQYDPAANLLTLHGSGWGLYVYGGDGCYFLNQALDGDQQITVRMLSRPAGGSWLTQAGVMIRESLQIGARHLTLGIADGKFTPPEGLTLQWRTATDGDGKITGLVPLKKLTLPVVLRLTRRGNTITPAYSTDDGKSFTAGEAITFDPPLPTTLYYGLDATAGRVGGGARDSMATAQFAAPVVEPVQGP